MKSLTGADEQFSSQQADIALPAAFFTRMMPAIDDLAELKLTLFFLAAIRQKEGRYRYLRRAEFAHDADLTRGLAIVNPALAPEEILDGALQKAIDRGTLLQAVIRMENSKRQFYFLNDRAGKDLRRQLLAGAWRPAAADEIEILPPRPTLFGLYEENIGALTPMIAEAISEAQREYPRDWIEEAMRYAVERNIRNWRYIQRVLEAWQQEGRSRETTGRHLERHQQYAAGKWKDYIKS